MTDCNPLEAYGDSLNPYEYRLMGHYHKLGVCYETTQRTAERTQMSAATVSRTRRALERRGLITSRRMSKAEALERGLIDSVSGQPQTSITVVTVPVQESEATVISQGNNPVARVSHRNTPATRFVSTRFCQKRRETIISVGNQEKSLIETSAIDKPSSSERARADDGDDGNIFALYHQTFGKLVHSPMLADELKDAAREYPHEWIVEAFRLAGRANASGYPYIRAVLERWRAEGKSRSSPPSRADTPVIAETAAQRAARDKARALREEHKRILALQGQAS